MSRGLNCFGGTVLAAESQLIRRRSDCQIWGDRTAAFFGYGLTRREGSRYCQNHLSKFPQSYSTESSSMHLKHGSFRFISSSFLVFFCFLVFLSCRYDITEDLAKAEVAVKQERWNEAIALFTDAIRKQPKNPLPYLGIAKVYQATGNIDLNIQYLQFAEAQDPINQQALCRLAVLYSDSAERIRYRTLCSVVSSTFSEQEKRQKVKTYNQQFEAAKQLGYEPVEVRHE